MSRPLITRLSTSFKAPSSRLTSTSRQSFPLRPTSTTRQKPSPQTGNSSLSYHHYNNASTHSSKSLFNEHNLTPTHFTPSQFRSTTTTTHHYPHYPTISTPPMTTLSTPPPSYLLTTPISNTISQLTSFITHHPKRFTPLVMVAPFASALPNSPNASFDPFRDLGLDKVSFPELGVEIMNQTVKEKSLDEWLEADAILKLNHIRRRAALEDDVLDDMRKKMTFHDQKVQELHLEANGDYSPTQDRNFADAMKRDLHRTTSAAYGVSNGLTPEESKALEKWMQDRDSHNVVINYLCDDIANYLKSFCTDDISDVFDDILTYIPKLIPHYFITPFILNFCWSLIPSSPLLSYYLSPIDPRQWIPSKVSAPLRFISNMIRSKNILVDLRCFYNLSMVAFTSGTYFCYELTNRFPQIYKKFGYYLIYPFAWFLHHYGDTQLATHIIKASMKHEERVRMRNYEAKYGSAGPSINTQPKSFINPVNPQQRTANTSPQLTPMF